MLTYNKELIKYAKELRQNMTPWEIKLWTQFLRNYPIRFQRQKVIDNYIVDFYCAKARIVIELDGGGHYTEEQQKYDEERTEVLTKYNLQVIRICNLEIDNNFYNVCEHIDRVVKNLSLSLLRRQLPRQRAQGINPLWRQNTMDISKLTHADRSEVLVQALPYIQHYHEKTVVIKYGGNAMINKDLQDAVMTDIVLLRSVGVNVVLVHGGGPEINDMLSKIGKESKFVDGLRYTDEETIDVVQMVLAGKVNKRLVQLIEYHGGEAVGICGLDGKMIKAKKYVANDIGFVGDITEIDTTLIDTLLKKGYVPVVSTIGGGENGEVFNINADTAAAKIAAALGAEKLLLMTDIRGLLKDKDDESTLIHVVNVSEVPQLKSQGIISGGMIPKIDCCVEAVRRGVKRTHIIDGRIPHSILIEMLTDSGIGTMFL